MQKRTHDPRIAGTDEFFLVWVLNFIFGIVIVDFIYTFSLKELSYERLKGSINVSKIHLVQKATESITARFIPNLGFSQREQGHFNPDATAWASLALSDNENYADMINDAKNRIVSEQFSDGRILSQKGAENSFWTTYTVILCWKKNGGLENEISKAVHFILSTSGEHWEKRENSIIAHNPNLKGWPWSAGTHSWIEPTAMAILALKSCGYARHPRVSEAVRMILDRQLPGGGWNYGNTAVFGKTLRPEPETTGHALAAVAGLVERTEVALSIDYLNRRIKNIRTPFALSWTIFGLTSWFERPKNYKNLILQSLKLQDRYGDYDTSLLSKLVVAYKANGDLLNYITT